MRKRGSGAAARVAAARRRRPPCRCRHRRSRGCRAASRRRAPCVRARKVPPHPATIDAEVVRPPDVGLRKPRGALGDRAVASRLHAADADPVVAEAGAHAGGDHRGRGACRRSCSRCARRARRLRARPGRRADRPACRRHRSTEVTPALANICDDQLDRRPVLVAAGRAEGRNRVLVEFRRAFEQATRELSGLRVPDEFAARRDPATSR